MKKYAIVGAGLVILLSIIVWFVRLDRCDDTDQICLIKSELRDYSYRLDGYIPDLRYRDGKEVKEDLWMDEDVALTDIAKAFAYAGDSRSALKIIDRIDDDERHLDDVFKAYAQVELAGTYVRLGDKEKADALFHDAVKTMERHNGRGNSLRQEIPVSLGKHGEKEKARSLLSHWIKVAETKGDLKHTLYMAAKACAELGEITKDTAFLEEAIKITDRITHGADKYRCLIAIASSYAGLGEKEKARSLLLQAINHATKQELETRYGYHLEEVVHACAKTAESTKDRALLKDATNVVEQMVDDYFKIDALNAIAESYAGLGDKDKALALLKNAIETADRNGADYFKVLALTAMAEYYAGIGKKEKAHALLGATIKMADRISDRNFYGASLTEIAGSYVKVGAMTKDRALLEEAIKIADRINNYELTFGNMSLRGDTGKTGVLIGIARSYARLGETMGDVALLEEAIKVAERPDLDYENVAFFEIVKAYVNLAESSNDPESFLIDNIFKRPLPDYCKNQALDAILASKSKSALADVGKLRSLTSHYSNEAGKALALARILTVRSRPDLIGK